MATHAAALTSVTTSTFEREVLKASKPVLVDFSAEWCPPCKMLAPILAEIAREQSDKLSVVTVDVDENPPLTDKYGVVGMPTLMLFQNGQPTARIVGYMPKAKILSQLQPVLAK